MREGGLFLLGRSGPRLSHGIVASCALLANVLVGVSALPRSGETSSSNLAWGGPGRRDRSSRFLSVGCLPLCDEATVLICAESPLETHDRIVHRQLALVGESPLETPIRIVHRQRCHAHPCARLTCPKIITSNLLRYRKTAFRIASRLVSLHWRLADTLKINAPSFVFRHPL